MCGCKTKTASFTAQLQKAEKYKEATNKRYGVFFINGVPNVKKVTDIRKDERVCCYFLPNGTPQGKKVTK